MTKSEMLPGRASRRPPLDWQRVRPLLACLLDLPDEEHDAFLLDACDGDEELARHVRDLLARERAEERFLESPERVSEPLSGDGPPVLHADAGDAIGPYRLVRRLGEGGMGTVWLAERDEGTFEQRVAIKLLKRGFNTVEFLARFRNERQVLAWLDHPSIARIVDGGHLENGLPYLVMEHVDGVRIDRSCDDGKLSIEARIELFVTVCEAVQHAHERGVIHRDLKPSNVLVDRDGRARLLDFGIAKVLGAESDEEAFALTRTGQRLYSPHYASPEQVQGDPVSAASDVYSLGIVLYQLLSGGWPYHARSLSQFALERMICEEEPTRPSRVEWEGEEGEPAHPWSVRGFAHERGLRSRLAGDLDWILLGCLRKDPARRYASAVSLADDLRRHLAGRPVAARPESLRYRASRFVSRNRGLVASVAVAFAAITVAFLVTLFQLGRTRAAEENAGLEARVARLQAAEAAIRDNDIAEASTLLEKTPPADRAWEWRHLHARLDRSARRASVDDSIGGRLDFDRYSRRFGFASQYRVMLVDPETGELASSAPLDVHAEAAGAAIAFHPAGNVLAAVLGDRRARILDARTLELRGVLDVPGVRNLEFSPDGDRLVLVLDSDDLALVSWPSLTVEHILASRVEKPYDARFSPDGLQLAVAGWDEDVRLFDVSDGAPELERSLVGHSMAVQSLAFDPAGERLVTGSLDQTVRVWSLAAPTRAPFVFREHRKNVQSVQFHAPSGDVVSRDDSGLVLRWRPGTGEIVNRIRGEGGGMIGVSPDGRWIVSSHDRYGSLTIWPADSDDVRRMYCCEFTDRVVFTPDGRTVLASAPDGTIRRWRLDGSALPDLRKDGTPLRLTSPSGAPRIAALHTDGRVTTWDESGRELSTDRNTSLTALVDGAFLEAVSCGTLTAVVMNDRVRVHDARQGEVVAEIEFVGNRVVAVTWIPGSTDLLVFGDQGLVWTWNPKSREGPRDVARIAGDVSHREAPSTCFLPGSNKVIVANDSGTIQLFDLERGTPKTLRSSGTGCNSLAAHPSEARFAVGYRDGSIGIWDSRRGRELVQLHGHQGIVRSLAFSPDGSLLASCSDGGWVHLWDAPPLRPPDARHRDR